MSATAAILDFAASPHILPPAVRADALRLLADTLAVGAAGSSAADVPAVLASVRSYSEGPIDSCRVLGSGLRHAPISTAFVNGFQIHCLEWDAVHEPAVVHALSVVTAALLAASDGVGGSDPDAFITALAVGVDIASGLGIAATGPMRFFRPATAGVIGAALAVARLAALDRGQMADVLGLAYSFAGGTMQAHVEGSVALPLQIGRAAQAAVQAVDLVKAGLTGPHDVLEGPFGYAALIEPIDLSRYVPGQPWRISEVSTKPYPSGRASHAVLAALADARESGRNISAITVHVPPLIRRLIDRPFSPAMTPGYARLCLPLLAALMLRDGRIDPRSFTGNTFASPLVGEMAALLRIEPDDNVDANALSPQRLVIDYADSAREHIMIADTLGSPKAPMTQAQVAQKLSLCFVLAGDIDDTRVFDDPLAFATDPR